MDVFDDENVISAASSPQENPSPLSLEEQRLRTSSPGLHSTIDPFFHLSGPHPSTSYRFAPSSAPELSPPYLAYSDLPSQSFKDPVAAPDTYWSSSADLASSKAFPGTRSQFDHFLAAEFDPPEGIVDVAGPSPGVLPNLLSQSVPSGSFHSHQQQTKSCDSLPSVHLGEHHHLRRASYPAPTWSSYQLSQDAIPTQINSQNDVLPPLSTLFLGYHRGLSTYNPFDLNTPPTIARQPFELHPVNQDGGDLDSTITHYRGLDDIYSRPEACLNLEPKTDARLPAIPAAGRIPSGPTHHGVTVTYTDDAVSKETQHVRRVCFNCQATEPPSWRRSALNPGKIVSPLPRAFVCLRSQFNIDCGRRYAIDVVCMSGPTFGPGLIGLASSMVDVLPSSPAGPTRLPSPAIPLWAEGYCLRKATRVLNVEVRIFSVIWKLPALG